MGAWGIGIFENDDACDWLDGLADTSDFSLIETTLDAALKAEYLEIDLSSHVLAASEIITAIIGKPSSYLPPEVVRWTSDKPIPGQAFIKHSIIAINKVLITSELEDAWKESNDYVKWKGLVINLRERLQ